MEGSPVRPVQGVARRPLPPACVIVVAAVLPGVGQALNATPARGLTMVAFMLVLGFVTFKLAAPGTSVVGQFAGAIFIYLLSVLDAYYWARYRREIFVQRESMIDE